MAYRGAYLRRRNFLNGFSHEHWIPPVWHPLVGLLSTSYLGKTLMFVNIKVVGRENIDRNTSYIFVANHQGAFDIWAIYGYLNHNFKWLMKKSLEKIFMVGPACKRAHHIFVDDSNIAAIKQTIAEAEDTLKEGMSLVIFPEGSRSWDGKMIPFKRGAKCREDIESALPDCDKGISVGHRIDAI